MQSMHTRWNPGLYLKFREQRTLPARDLLRRIDISDPLRILDVGCGPGNSTTLLAERWPKAAVTGIDTSQDMIEKARQDYPHITWLLKDANGDLSELSRFDLVFSNAALQWMPDHTHLLANLFALLGKGGVLAVQVPNNVGTPIHRAIRTVAENPKWSHYFTSNVVHFYDSAEEYYRQVSFLTPAFSLWETIYYHVMDSVDDLLLWYRGSHLRLYLGQLPEDQVPAFEQDIKDLIMDQYLPQPDGKLLFPFRRIFFTAVKV